MDYSRGEIVAAMAGCRRVALGEGDGDGVVGNMMAVLTEELHLSTSNLSFK